MSNLGILVFLAGLAAFLLGCVAVFCRLWDRAAVKVAHAVKVFVSPGTPTRAIDSSQTIRRELAWMLDVPQGCVLPRKDYNPKGQPCGVVVILRGDCDPARRETARDVEVAVRVHLGAGMTFSIVMHPHVEQVRRSTRAA